MKTNREIRQLAKEQIRGNIGTLFLVELVIYLVTMAVSSILGITVIGSVLVFCVAPTFAIARCMIYLKMAEQGEKPKVEDCFSGINNFWSATKAYLLQALYICLWMLLLFVPGIIKGFSYSQTFYIVAENKGIGGNEAITRSRQMMKGHKWQFFMLNLSFIGWILLVALTFGIAAIWVVPYMQAAMTNFYVCVRDLDKVAVEPEEQANGSLMDALDL